MNTTDLQKHNQRVVTFLNRDEVDFLDKLGKDALFSNGTKLSRTKLISWTIDFVKSLNVSGENIKTQKDLEKKILDTLTPPATGKKTGGAE